MARWRFDDPVDSSTYTFELSPSEGGTSGYAKQVSTKPVLAPEAGHVIFEGADQAQEIEFKGTILSEAHLDALVEWFGKRHPVQLTDDLGRVFRVYLTELRPTRKRASQYPFKHEYSMKCLVLPS